MLTRWTIRPAPTAADPHRRLLLLQAAYDDVQALVRKVGAACGRPKKERMEAGFNFSLFLHRLEDSQLSAVEAELQGLGAPARETKREEAPSAQETQVSPMKEDTAAAKGPPSSRQPPTPFPKAAGTAGLPAPPEGGSPPTEPSGEGVPAPETLMPGVEKIAGGGELLDLFEDAAVSFGPELPASATMTPPSSRQPVPPEAVPPAPLAGVPAARAVSAPAGPSPLSRAPLCGAISAADG